MRKYHINYANGRYLQAQTICSQTAKSAGFDEVISYSIGDIDNEFFEKNKHILVQPRGAGYWLWKPYFIYKTLLNMQDGDLLVYSDSGSYYEKHITPLIDLIKKEEKGVLSFELHGLFEKTYTKRDTFILMGLDEEIYSESSQREATYIWLIKNEFTVSLIKEFLEYSQDERIITDLPSESKNHDDFKDHRHDQSIWSLLCKKYEIPTHKLMSQWGDGMTDVFPQDTYSKITFHHRNSM
jgi:hypothetical protein